MQRDTLRHIATVRHTHTHNIDKWRISNFSSYYRTCFYFRLRVIQNYSIFLTLCDTLKCWVIDTIPSCPMFPNIYICCDWLTKRDQEKKISLKPLTQNALISTFLNQMRSFFFRLLFSFFSFHFVLFMGHTKRKAHTTNRTSDLEKPFLYALNLCDKIHK